MNSESSNGRGVLQGILCKVAVLLSGKRRLAGDVLTALFGGKTKARILDVPLSNPDQTYHLRGPAQAAGTDSGNTGELLRVQVDGGVVRALAEPLRPLFARAGWLMEDQKAEG